MSFFKTIKEDIQAVKERDPAAQGSVIIFLTYPGLHARWMHIPEHWLWTHGWRRLARVISQTTRFFTGVEIHPGAQIGRRFFIDHAMGVIIGETTIIGDDCTLYQGVTLGGTGHETGKRHPTLGNNVLVGVGACVLGNVFVGDGSKVGGGAVVVDDVPPNSTVVGIPGRVVRRDGKRVADETAHQRSHKEFLPDPERELEDVQNAYIRDLVREVQCLRRVVEEHGIEIPCAPAENRAATSGRAADAAEGEKDAPDGACGA